MRLDRNVGRRADDFLPRRAQNDFRRFRIEPEIEFVPRIVQKFRIVGLRTQAAAHEDEFLRQFRELRIERNRQREVGHRPALIDRDLMRILVHHANQKMRRIFVGRLGRRLPLRQRRHDRRLHATSAHPTRPA